MTEPDLTQWRIDADHYGDMELRHLVCSGRFGCLVSVGWAETLAEILDRVAAHDCPGPAAPRPAVPRPVLRCEHGAPVQFRRQHPPVTFRVL